MDTIRPILDQAQATQADPTWWVVALTAVTAAALVVPGRAWPLTRNVVTIAHEGGHALVALLTGRRLDGIRLHSDTSGVTVTAGKSTGLGMILTAAAGYTAPSLLGLLAAWTLHHGYITATLWATIGLLALMLVMIRNLFGVLTVCLTGAAIFAVSWWTPLTVQAAFAYLLAWFLLVSGPRPIWELHHKRRAGEAADSDADQLARLTGIPGLVWVLGFGLSALLSAAAGARWLLS